MPNGARPSRGEFTARLFSGILDSWTARHQQGQAQQREDVVYQQQLADKERLAGERREFEVEREDIAYGRKRELVKEAEPTKLEKFMDMLDAQEALKGKLRLESEAEIATKKELAALGLWAPRVPGVPKPPKPYGVDKIKKDLMGFFPREEGWIDLHSGDVAQYIARALPRGTIPTLDDYHHAKRSIVGRNVIDTMFDRPSGIQQMMAQAGIESVDEQFISSEDAMSVLGAYGLIPEDFPEKNWSVPELSHFIASNWPKPAEFLNADIPHEQQPYGALVNGIQELLQDAMAERGIEGPPGPLKKKAEVLFKEYGGVPGAGGPHAMMMQDWIRRVFK